MRARPLRGGGADVLPSARADLPIVAWLEGEDAWVVFGGFQRGRVRLWRPDDPRGWRWVPLAQAIGSGVREWAFVEPALPACALAGDEEEGHLEPGTRLRRLLRVERQDLGVVVIFAVVAGVLALGTPIAVQLLINFLAFGAFFQPVFVLMLGLLLTLSLVALLQALQRWIVEIVQRRIFVRVVSDLSE